MSDPMIPIPPSPPHHADSDRLSRGVSQCLLFAVHLKGVIYRVASVRRANSADLLAGVGSQLTGGRWSPLGGFRAVYASRDEITALEEARQQNLRMGVPTWMALPLVLTAIEVDLQPVLDLTDGRVRQVLRVSKQRMLAEPWWMVQEQGEEALTQALSRLARDFGFVAIVTPSAARSQGANVVIYPDRIGPEGRLTVVNADRLPHPPN